jgi:hypothetical protein
MTASAATATESGLDFLLSHFSEPIWPRNVATAATNTKQHIVEDRDKALLYFKGALGQDCRIAIYPNFDRMKEMGYQNLGPSHIPDQLLIDIDLDDENMQNSKNGIMHNSVVKTTLRNIKKHLNGAVPTVIWTGNGVHILQPLSLEKALEDMPEFSKFRKNSTDVSVKFMRWAARRLSGERSDHNHNISFASCLTRCPGSINSKNGAEVKIVQRWNGVRTKVPKQFITDFLIALVQKEIDEKSEERKPSNIQGFQSTEKSKTTPWIEKLIDIPMADYRKNARDLILIPYLIVRRGASSKETYDIVMNWANKCAELRPLQPSYNAYESRVRTRIQEVLRDKVPPMTWAKFQEVQPDIAAELIKNRTFIAQHYPIKDMSTKTDNIIETDNELENESENQVPQNGVQTSAAEDEALKDYVKIRDGETHTLIFSTDPNKRRFGPHNFGKGPQDTMWFQVTTPDDPNYEREFRVTSKKLMRAIVNRYIKQGKTILVINRKGSTQTNTVYRIRTTDDDKELVITNTDEHWEQLPQQHLHK